MIKLAEFGCKKCGAKEYAPADRKLGYDVQPCRCGGEWYKDANAEIPEHIQNFWDNPDAY